MIYPLRLSSFNCDVYRLNHAVFVEVHPVNAGFAVVAIGLGEGTAVVNDKPVVGAGRVDDRVMPAPLAAVGSCCSTLPTRSTGPNGELLTA